MKKDRFPSDSPLATRSSLSYRSFSVAIEQMAQLLRSQAKLRERVTAITPTTKLPVSFKNTLEQIARLMRAEVHSLNAFKKPTRKTLKNLSQ